MFKQLYTRAQLQELLDDALISGENVEICLNAFLNYMSIQDKEIERLRALVATAIEHVKEHEQCYATPNRMTQWLKDVERGGE